jgi:heme exporter protein D
VRISFDKSMLTLSSGALGVSLAFIKDIVPLGTADWICLLKISWGAFALCILTTVVSFQFSIAALKDRRNLLDEMLTTKNRELEHKQTSLWNRAVVVCTDTALVLFLVGLVCTMLFVVKNVSSSRARNSEMSPAAPSVTNVRNFYMSDTGEVRKVVVPQDLTKGRQPAKLVPPPKAPAAPAPAPAQSTPKE